MLLTETYTTVIIIINAQIVRNYKYINVQNDYDVINSNICYIINSSGYDSVLYGQFENKNRVYLKMFRHLVLRYKRHSRFWLPTLRRSFWAGAFENPIIVFGQGNRIEICFLELRKIQTTTIIIIIIIGRVVNK